jgi:hypothetical protein
MANKKGRIVTKEELEKSGYTNLRDFLNAERGLKRRDGKAPERTEAYKAMEQMRRDREGNFRAQARKADVDMETPEERGAMNLAGFKRDKEKESASGLRKGGAVRSSASKRADGCAVRGKTKGRMV